MTVSYDESFGLPCLALVSPIDQVRMATVVRHARDQLVQRRWFSACDSAQTRRRERKPHGFALAAILCRSPKYVSVRACVWRVLLRTYHSVRRQVVTSVPTKKLPRCLRAGTDVTKEDMMEAVALSHPDLGGSLAEARSRGQILWVRSISRLQQQVGAPRRREEVPPAASHSANKISIRGVPTEATLLH